MKIDKLRAWLKTSPYNLALNESGIINATSSVCENHVKTSDIHFKDLVTFSKLQITSFVDLICQVCAICSTKNPKMFVLLVWDGTKSK